MIFNESQIFDGFKSEFDGSLDQPQVDAINCLLASFQSSLRWNDVRHIAYALATVFHETAGSMQPVEEGYYLARYGASRVKQFQKSLRYFPYFGRGYVQLTWETNYKKAGKALGIDLVSDPSMALDKAIAFDVMTEGMMHGWFSAGQTLSRYINDAKCDYHGARQIINGTDKAALIAGYAVKFEQILRRSLVSAAAAPASGPQSDASESAGSPAETSPTPGGQTGPSVADTTQPPTDVEVKKETPSLFVKIGAAFTALSGLGIQAGALVQNKLEQMTPLQVLYLLAALGLVVLAVWWYRKAAKGAQARTTQLVEKASDPAQNTVKLVK